MSEKIKNFEDLIQGYIGPNKTVVKTSVTNLLAPGENYLSEMQKLHVVTKNKQTEATEEYDFVAKCVVVNDMGPGAAGLMKTEINFYTRVLPALQKFQQKHGAIPVNFFPEYIGGRLNLTGTQKPDMDAVVILENLKVRGYNNLDRHVGCSLAEAKRILKDLAIFHSTALALKMLEPETYRTEIKEICVMELPLPPPQDDGGPPPGPPNFFPALLDYIKSFEMFSHVVAPFEKYRKHMETIMRNPHEMFNMPPREPFSTLTHGDLWLNNTMQKIQDGVILDNKLVDFQMPKPGSPAADLIFFLISSVQSDILRTDFEDLIKYYYDKFSDGLKQFGCYSNLFSYEEFLEEMKAGSVFPIYQCMFMLPTAIFTEKGKAHDRDTDRHEKTINDIPKEARKRLEIPYPFISHHETSFSKAMNQFAELKSPNSEIVRANYNKLSEHIRRLTPQGIQCSVFCGGLNCKYENPENWKPDSLAIQGIYSHWITDDILAMARPSTIVIVQKNIIQQFQSLGIKSIINLQSPREHASCGQPLENSGFAYNPNIFMEQNIYYYNFAWKDYGDATLAGLLNMVKVLAFALSEGRVAIHCHAGLGRTGVLIACFLVYSLRVTANDAIRYVRLKRPGSVQTRGQILCVRHFAQFILPQTITYFIKDLLGKDKYMNEFSLHRFLRRQKVVLHGYDERHFKFIPKIVHCICERILKLCSCWIDEFSPSNIPYTVDFLAAKIHGNLNRHSSTYSISSLSSTNSDQIFLNAELVQSPGDMSSPSSPNPSEMGDVMDSFSELSTLDGEEMSEELLLENRCFQELECQKSFAQEQIEEEIAVQDITVAVEALITDMNTLNGPTKKKIREYQHQLNSSQVGWIKLNVETDLNVLASLLYEWLEGLKVPIIKMEDFENIVVHYKDPELCMQKFPLEECYLIEYLLKFFLKIHPVSKEHQEDMLRRMIAALSKHSVLINNNTIPSGKGFKKIGDGTLTCTYHLFQSLAELIENHTLDKPDMTYNHRDNKISENSDIEDDFQ